MTNAHDDDKVFECDNCEGPCELGTGNPDRAVFCCRCSGFDKADLCAHCATVGEREGNPHGPEREGCPHVP